MVLTTERVPLESRRNRIENFLKGVIGYETGFEISVGMLRVPQINKKGIVEEAPQVYKDVDEVVKVSHSAGIGNLVAKMKPIGGIKG